jgi:hypothetical protein
MLNDFINIEEALTDGVIREYTYQYLGPNATHHEPLPSTSHVSKGLLSVHYPRAAIVRLLPKCYNRYCYHPHVSFGTCSLIVI